jgi:DNA-binding FadR family transcriptional regulator
VPSQQIDLRRQYRRIADQITTLVATGEFPAGSQLPAERDLANRLGVSRASVRDAVIVLAIRGVVEIRDGVGIFAIAPSQAAGADRDEGAGPLELLNARWLVEGEVAALAAQEATADDVAGLRRAIERMAAHVDDFAIREECDRDFHLRLAAATGNGSLQSVVAQLWDERAELWQRMERHFHTKELEQQTIRDHAAIVRAVAARDPVAARAAMHRHLSRVAKEFQRDIEKRSAHGERAAKGVAKPKLRGRRPPELPR